MITTPRPGEEIASSASRSSWIEAYVIWTSNARAGFQSERIIRLEDFVMMVETLQLNPRHAKPLIQRQTPLHSARLPCHCASVTKRSIHYCNSKFPRLLGVAFR
jgi:hypothetical protein